jgi:hypothetical protein
MLSQIQVGDGYQKVWAGVLMHRDHACGLEFEFGDADSIFHEEDFAGAAVEDVEAAGCVPFESGVAEFVVLQEFDGDVAEGLGGKIAGNVGETGGEKLGVPVVEVDGNGIFALDGIYYLGGAEDNVDVVVAVAVHESFGVRRDVDIEDADSSVGEDEVVVGLGGDFHFWGGLGGEKCGQEEEKDGAAHGRDCSSGQLPVDSGQGSVTLRG